MNICLCSCHPEEKRFSPFLSLKGSFLFRRPNLEILKLLTIARELKINAYYIDEQIEELKPKNCEFLFLYTSFENIERVYEILGKMKNKTQIFFFGPAVTKFPNIFLKEGVCIRGYIPNIFKKVIEDISKKNVKNIYKASAIPRYYYPYYPVLKEKRGIFFYQALETVMGCNCDPEEKESCINYLYFKDNIRERRPEEVIMEASMFRKRFIELLDDDIGKRRHYYIKLFSGLWQLRKDWIVNAGSGIFENPEYIRFLAKAGVKVVFLKKSWFPKSFYSKEIKQKVNEVKKLHSEKILAGLRITLTDKENINPDEFWRFILKTKLDFVEVKYEPSSINLSLILQEPRGRFYLDEKSSILPFLKKEPFSFPKGITEIKARFYSLPRIVTNFIFYPFTQGIYNTFWVYAPRAFAYRENYLEGIAFPP